MCMCSHIHSQLPSLPVAPSLSNTHRCIRHGQRREIQHRLLHRWVRQRNVLEHCWPARCPYRYTFGSQKATSSRTLTYILIHLFTHTDTHTNICLCPLPLSICLKSSTISTCPLAPGKMCCCCLSSFCHSWHAPKWPPRLYLSVSLRCFILIFNHRHTHTHTYLWLFTCHGSQLLMIPPAVVLFPCITSPLSWGRLQMTAV